MGPQAGSHRAAAPVGPRYAPTSLTRRAALTAGTAVGLSGLYAAYAATVTPLLEHAAREATGAADARPTRIVPPKSNRNLAERFLSHAPWATEANYQIGSGRSVMYWNEWEIVERGAGESLLVVSPFAVAIVDDDGPDARNPGEEGAKRPTTLVADKAALRFEKPISADAVASPGRVVGAVFRGAVRVDGEDGLRVAGTRFDYREGEPGAGAAMLISDSPVSFRHGSSKENPTGGHEGGGAGVEVKLFRTRGAGEYDNVAVDGLAEVAVLGPVAVTLRGGGLPGLDAAGGPLTDPAADRDRRGPAEPRQPVRITATEKFVFDPHANTARFTSVGPGGVRAWREQPAGTVPATPEQAGPDELLCDDLRVRFAPATDAARAEADAVRAARQERHWGERKFYAADGDLEAVAVVATGAPVRVTSPARNAVVTAARLEHDVAADVLTLTGRPGADGKPGLVNVSLPNSEIACPRLVVSPPDSPPGVGVGAAGVNRETADSPRRLRCAGPGTLRRTDPQTGAPAARVIWPGALVTSRDAATGRDVVVLTGPNNPRRNREGHTELADQVLVQTFAEGADLAADRVVLELEPNPKADAGAANGGALEGADPLGGSVRPAKAIASGSVRMKGPELLAGSKRVEVTFADPPPRRLTDIAPDAAATPGAAPAGTAANPAATTADGSPVAAAEPEPKEPGPPTKFYADEVVATVVRPRTENGVEVAEGYVSAATATGGVGLFQDAPPPDENGEPGDPRFARAARAVVTGTGPGEQVLTLFGTPATADSLAVPAELNGSGADLTGPEIRFNPQENTATVVGAGSIDLPVRGGGMPGFARPGGTTEPTDTPVVAGTAGGTAGGTAAGTAGRKTVRVNWAESMTFDGSVATFHGGTNTLFRGTGGVAGSPDFTEDTVRLYCQLMTVTLTEPVIFGDRLPGGAKKRSGPNGGEKPDPEIRLITCHGRVDVRGRQDAPDPRHADVAARLTPREAQRMEARFAQLEVTWKTGDFTAEGPGEMKVWRRDDKVAPPPVRSGTVRPNAPSSRQVALPCELIHVTFNREVVGNLNGPDATFHPGANGRVEVIHGPVGNFGDALLKHAADPLPEGASRMESRRLELRHVTAAGATTDAEGKTVKTRELFASGDVEVDSRGETGADGRPGAWVSANAPRAAFNEAKGRLELSGTADGPVRLYRKDTETAPADLFTGRTVVFFPGTNEVKLKDVQVADGLP